MPNLPLEFVQRMKNRLGDAWEAYAESFNQKASTYIRLNPSKPASSPHDAIPLNYARHAYQLNTRPSFNNDPLFHSGCYYVQEAGSMFLEWVYQSLSIPKDAVVFELCSAPGGKSTHLLSLMQGSGVLICNEPIPQRNSILQQNIFKWGYDNCIIIQADATKIYGIDEIADLVLLDAPCSGEGLFRKDPDAVTHWSAAAVEGCSRRQKELIHVADKLTKPQGYIIYSTCTFEEEENEHVIQYALENLNASIVEVNENQPAAGVEFTKFGWRFYPHKTCSEGFFISVIQSNHSKTDVFNYEKAIAIEHESTKNLFSAYVNTNKYEVIKIRDTYYACNMAVLNILPALQRFNIKSAGIPLGSLQSGVFKPHPALALSNHLHYDKKIDLDKNEALQYLAGNTLPNHNNAKGIHLISFQGHPLGWVNAIQGRLNNLYPHEWRIRLKQ